MQELHTACSNKKDRLTQGSIVLNLQMLVIVRVRTDFSNRDDQFLPDRKRSLR